MKIRTLLSRLLSLFGSSSAPAADPAAETTEPPNRQTTEPAETLDFRWGGFKGGNAVEDPGAQIGSVRMTSKGMSYKWKKGGCETLGATSRTDCDHTLVCAFFWDAKAKKWVGGKFDWISTSRLSRDWKNIRDGYAGWNADKFFAATRHAFCIVSKDGKRRTNLAEAGR